MKLFKVTVNRTESYNVEGTDSMSVLEDAMDKHGPDVRIEVEEL